MNISVLVSRHHISLAQAPRTFIYSALKFTIANFEAEEKFYTSVAKSASERC